MRLFRFVSLLLFSALSLSLLFCTVTAAQAESVFVGGVELTDNTYLPTGGTAVQSTCPSGGYAFYNKGILTLKDFTYEGMGLYNEEYNDYSGIYTEGDLTIRVVGDSLIDVTSAGDKTSYAIVADALTIEAGPLDCLTAWGTYCGIYTTGQNPFMTQKGGTVYAYGDAWGAIADITLEEGAITLSNGDYYDDIYEGDTSYGALFGTLNYASALYAYGSEDPEGSTLKNYKETDTASYDYILVEGKSIYVGGVEMINRSYLPEGNGEIQFSPPTVGGYAFYANGTLLLKDYSYEGAGHYDSTWGDYSGISAEIPLVLRLEGENRISLTGAGKQSGYGLVAASVEIIGQQDSSLFLSANYAGINTTGENPALVVQGGTVHSVGDYWGAIADVTVKGGSLILQNRDTKDELYYEESYYSALYGTISAEEDMIILGAEDTEGTNTVPYVQANQDFYDYIRVSAKEQEPEIDSGIRFQHTLELASDISIHFVIAKTLLAGYDMDSAYVECTIADYDGNASNGTTRSVLRPVLRGSYYYFTFTGLNAVRMNDLVTARFYGTKNGSAYVSASDVYSVSTYAYAQLSKSTVTQELKVLCANLLRYGSMAQQYKSYRTDSLADATMTDAHRAYLSDIEAVTFGNTNRVLNDLDNAPIAWAGKSLNLESKVALKFVFNPAGYDGDIEALTLRISYEDTDGNQKTVDIEEHELYNPDMGLYVFTFDGLLAAELRTVVSVQVYAGETPVSCTLQYSADTYGNNKTGNLLELCKALFAYSDSAKAYFQ